LEQAKACPGSGQRQPKQGSQSGGGAAPPALTEAEQAEIVAKINENTPCWFVVPDETVQNGDDCRRVFKEKGGDEETCEGGTKGPIHVPFLQYDVCTKFPKANVWFRTHGCMGKCWNKCCMWHSDWNCDPLAPEDILKFFRMPAGVTDCNAVTDQNLLAMNGPALIDGNADGEEATICIKGFLEDSYKQDTISMYNCANGCCSFFAKE